MSLIPSKTLRKSLCKVIIL